MALTEKQARFARLLGSGMSQTDAARGAGYCDRSEVSLRVTGHKLAKHPEIQRAAFQEREAILAGSLANKALATLGNILDDETAPAPAKVSAAKFILESAGHGIESRKLSLKAAETMKRGLADMTNEELIEFIRNGEANQQAASSQTIEVESTDTEETDA
jgi:hypothetical protein